MSPFCNEQSKLWSQKLIAKGPRRVSRGSGSHNFVGNFDVSNNRCQGKKSCTIPGNFAALFGDPCHGTYKYLNVTYECMLPTTTTTTTTTGLKFSEKMTCQSTDWENSSFWTADPDFTGSWQKYSGKNCYQGQGADNMSPEPYSNSISLSDCKNACETDDACEGIVVKRGEESAGRCFKRKNIKLGDCSDNSQFDLYLKPTGMQ